MLYLLLHILQSQQYSICGLILYEKTLNYLHRYTPYCLVIELQSRSSCQSVIVNGNNWPELAGRFRAISVIPNCTVRLLVTRYSLRRRVTFLWTNSSGSLFTLVTLYLIELCFAEKLNLMICCINAYMFVWCNARILRYCSKVCIKQTFGILCRQYSDNTLNKLNTPVYWQLLVKAIMNKLIN